MADKEILAQIRDLEQRRPTVMLETYRLNSDEGSTPDHRLAEVLVTLETSWRVVADLYEVAKVKGAKSLYIEPLRHAAAEVAKVAAALRQPRGAKLHEVTAGPGPRTRERQCDDVTPHERHPNGTGEVTGDALYCLGVQPPRDLTGLDQLIADSAAEGRGQLRRVLPSVPAINIPLGLLIADSAAESRGQLRVEIGPTATGEVHDVTAYLSGKTSTLPGLAGALVPGSVRSVPEAGNPFASAEDVADAFPDNGCTHGADCNIHPEANTVHNFDADGTAVPAMPIGHSFNDNADCVTCSLCSEACLTGNLCTCCRSSKTELVSTQVVIVDHLHGVQTQPVTTLVPKTWESDTMTADGHRIPGSTPAGLPPAPLLGQPGDAGAGFDPLYIPPGAVPFTLNNLMTPVPLAALPPHLSHSQLDTVGECPAKYRQQRVEGVTQIPQWALIGGNAFHAAAEEWERAAIAEPERAKSAALEVDCEARWRRHFTAEIEKIEANSPVPRALWRASKRGAEGETWWNANGPEMLRRYLAARPDERTMVGQSDIPCIEAELQVDVQTPYGPLPFRAVLDRATLRFTEPNTAPIIVIRDYKTGDRMPDGPEQLAEQAWTLVLHSAFPVGQVVPGAILGTYFNARKGTWTEPVDLLAEYPWDWFVYRVTSGHAEKLALTTGPTPARKTSFCGGCSVKWSCPIGGPKR